MVALVGSSGGGKSSIVKLIQHFYMPSQGQVRFDGRDVGLYNPKWLRRRVAIVNQVGQNMHSWQACALQQCWQTQ